jgi:subtilisin-like proprotein convertase family protein
MRSLLFLLLSFAFALSVSAQSNYWNDVAERNIFLPQESEVAIAAQHYRSLQLDKVALEAVLEAAPMEFTREASRRPVQVVLPLPDGQMETFEVVESPVMAPELAAKFPKLKAYAARSVERPYINARFDLSPYGFYALVHTPEGQVLIEPYATKQSAYYISYNIKDIQMDADPDASLACGLSMEDVLHAQQEDEVAVEERTALSFRSNEPVELRHYRLALACTGEYAQQKGGTVESVMATFNTSVNLVNAIYLNDVAVRFELIPDNDEIVFLDPDDDPYNNTNNGAGLLDQNVIAINSTLEDFTSYDIGHLFNGPCNTGGIAQLGSTCGPSRARGLCCHYTNLTYIATQVMTHEIGHQFNANHTFNSCNGGTQRSGGDAYEPGSGSTIMSYQFLCGPDNVTDPVGEYFNTGSLEDMIRFYELSGGSLCGERIPTENNHPVVTIDYEDGFWIPISTPFELNATGEDANGDALTYCWEQYDLGPEVSLGEASLNSPLFRSFPPRPASNRVFPEIADVITGNTDDTEILPDYERDLTFRVTVRDNNPIAGGLDWTEVAFKSDANAGPFRVLTPVPDAPEELQWQGGEYREVNWDVANTTNNRVNCQYVDVLLSVDGGFTYPYTLLEGTPNDGSEFVTVPDVDTDDARIRVQASNNIFFNISEEDFTIAPATVPGYTMGVSPGVFPLLCLPGDEEITVEVFSGSILGYDSLLALDVVGLLPTGAAVAFEADTLLAGENTTLTLNIPLQEAGRDTFDLQLRAISADGDTSLRPVRIIALSSDFSELALESPEDGTNGVLFSTDFSWVDVPSAETYDFEIATQPNFAEEFIVERATGINAATYQPENLLEEQGQLYFWRVRPVNECGPGEFLPPFVLQTENQDCKATPADDLPISLPNIPVEQRSRIFVAEDGIISDINISRLDITFSPISALKVTLVSPAETEVVLFDQSCLNTTLLRASFDDEAPSDINCPPISFTPVQPEEPLSILDGEGTFGEWELIVEVAEEGFGGGTIKDWNLEFCASLTPEAPILVTNETLGVPRGLSNTITAEQLKAESSIGSPQDLEFKLLTTPQHGQLFRGVDLLEMGDEFTQSTIDGFNLTYQHDGGDSETDQFTFVVKNEVNNGWIPTQRFSIVVDEDAVVNTQAPDLDQTLTVFPNPATDEVFVDFGFRLNGRLTVEVFSLQGQRLQQFQYDEAPLQLQLPTSNWASGVYLLHFRSEQGRTARKLIVK